MSPLPFSEVNLVAVVVATVVNMIVGFVWFSKSVFGTVWLEHAKITVTPDTGMGRALTMGVVSTLVSTFALGLLLVLAAPATLGGALTYGALWFVAVAMPLHSNAVGWEHRSPTLVAINAGWTVVSIALTIGILHWWPW